MEIQEALNIAARIIEDQGFLVVSGSTPRKVDDTVPLYFSGELALGRARVIAESSRKEYHQQILKYYGITETDSINRYFYRYFYRIVAVPD